MQNHPKTRIYSQHTVPFGTYFGRGGSTNGNDRTVFLTINTSGFTT